MSSTREETRHLADGRICSIQQMLLGNGRINISHKDDPMFILNAY